MLMTKDLPTHLEKVILRLKIFVSGQKKILLFGLSLLFVMGMVLKAGGKDSS